MSGTPDTNLAPSTEICSLHLHRQVTVTEVTFNSLMVVFWSTFDTSEHREALTQSLVVVCLLALDKLVLLDFGNDLCLQVVQGFQVSLKLCELFHLRGPLLFIRPQFLILITLNYFWLNHRLLFTNDTRLSFLRTTQNPEAHEALSQRECCPCDKVFYLACRGALLD